MDNQNPQDANQAPAPADDPKSQIVDRLKQANNVLVTVSSNPSVDQLAACIGLTLLLNKMDKHATAVFSGAVPSTIEFLQPEATLEKNTDSLRDFIISLDKSKADKLRYKVEDKVVKIFITPYKTSISEKDLEFSQGDFNVDVVVALGVHEQKDLDQAITAHGRILHDAKVTTISVATPSELGTVNWQDASASSLSELVSDMGNSLGPNLLDGQIATALLTGIVSETNRFSNEKTSPRTMSASAALMSAGANQQLIATKLEPPEEPPAVEPAKPNEPGPQPPAGPPSKPADAPPKDTLEVHHDTESDVSLEDMEKANELELVKQQQIHIDEEGRLRRLDELKNDQSAPPENPPGLPGPSAGSKLIVQPPTLGGTLTANSRPEELKPAVDGMNLPVVNQPMLSHDQPGLPNPAKSPAPAPTPLEPPQMPLQPLAPAPTTPPPSPPAPEETLEQLEQSVESPHVNNVDDINRMPPPSPQPAASDIASLSDAAKAAAASTTPLPAPEALGSQYVADNLHPDDQAPILEPLTPEPAPALPPIGLPPSPNNYEPSPGGATNEPPTMPLPAGNQFPPNLVHPTTMPPIPPTNTTLPPTAPPPVPPPFNPQ